MDNLNLIIDKYPIFHHYNKNLHSGIYFQIPNTIPRIMLTYNRDRDGEVISLHDYSESMIFRYSLIEDKLVFWCRNYNTNTKWFYFNLFDCGIEMMDDIDDYTNFNMDMAAVYREWTINNIINPKYEISRK